MTRKLVISTLSLALILELYVGWDGFTTRNSRQASKSSIKKIYHSLRVGMDEDSVERLVAEQTSESLTKSWSKSPSASYLTLAGPYEFGAGNWILTVKFDSEKAVDNAWVRTPDTPGTAPSGLPDLAPGAE